MPTTQGWSANWNKTGESKMTSNKTLTGTSCVGCLPSHRISLCSLWIVPSCGTKDVAWSSFDWFTLHVTNHTILCWSNEFYDLVCKCDESRDLVCKCDEIRDLVCKCDEIRDLAHHWSFRGPNWRMSHDRPWIDFVSIFLISHVVFEWQIAWSCLQLRRRIPCFHLALWSLDSYALSPVLFLRWLSSEVTNLAVLSLNCSVVPTEEWRMFVFRVWRMPSGVSRME